MSTRRRGLLRSSNEGGFGATHTSIESSNQVKEEPIIGGHPSVQGVSDGYASVAAAATADAAAVAAAATVAVESSTIVPPSSGAHFAPFAQCSPPEQKATDFTASSPVVKISHPVAVGIVPVPLYARAGISITDAGSGIARIERGSLAPSNDPPKQRRVLAANMTSNPSAAKSRDRATSGKRSRDSTPSRPTRRKRLCEHESCPRRPCFGFEGDSYPAFCKEHKMDGQVDIVTSRCEQMGCNVTPSFRFDGDKRTRFCAAHKMAGMTDIHRISRSCKFGKGCQTNPSFGFEGGRRISCSKHRSKGMINLNIFRRCHQGGCNLIPNFGLPGQAATSCASHRSEGMINVVSKRCEVASCGHIPSYNFEQPGARAAFCSQHKTEGMVNVRHQRCSHPGCRRQPSFGAAGGKVATFCKEHKTPEMVDVKNTEARKEAAKGKRSRQPTSAH